MINPRKRATTLGNEEGQALVEYALILLLIALVTVGALTLLGTTVSNMLTSVLAGF